MLNGCVFTLASRKQQGVSTSTAEVEYIAMGNCAMQVKWIRSYMAELGFDMQDATIMHVDNAAANAGRKIQSQCVKLNTLKFATSMCATVYKQAK
eukprot:IDg2074t1